MEGTGVGYCYLESTRGGDTVLWAVYIFVKEVFFFFFNHPSESNASGEERFKIHQSNKLAIEYALTFHTLTVQALIPAYLRGLRDDILRELVCRDQSLTLNQLISL